MNPILIIITLILSGILFMLIEFLLVPGIGVAGIVGLASFVGACVYAFMVEGTKTGTITTAAVILVGIILLIWMLRGKTWKRFELKTEIDSKVNTESEGVKVGDCGTALTRLAPMGTVRFGNLSCEAHSDDNSMIAAGTEVEVVSIIDNRVSVKIK